jgi:UDP-N-acetylmuramoyl-tripeptide--D-alanyl-D-alanine ligase
VNLIDTAVLFILFVGFAVFSFKRLMTYLHALQQEDYANMRLLRWMFKYKVFDKKLSLTLGVSALASLFVMPFYTRVLVFILFAAFIYLEKDPRKFGKKKLVLTARAKRILWPSLVLMVLAGAGVIYVGPVWLWIGAVQAIPFVLMFVTFMLSPQEFATQRRFMNEARARLQDVDPTIIAVTGSFGKTSVKHILGHILKTQAPTLMTPGSVNTAMGTTRVIREELQDHHKYLVVEMGAYGEGSIDRLCALTPPDIGIITAVGHAHYERFKTLDAVARAKYELADSVIGRGGMVVVGENTLKYPYPAQLFKDKADNFLICYKPVEDARRKKKLSKDHLQVDKIRQSIEGLKVKLTYEGKSYTLDVPLYGKHHGYNTAMAFAVAVQLGIEPDHIKMALKSLPQIAHRLEMKKQADGTLILDDAFNSNPRGFRAALDVLAGMDKHRRRILITPGMVELGETHTDAHEKIGRYAGQVCDVVIVVQAARIPSFVEGVKATSGAGLQIIAVDRFTDAARWIANNKQEGDVVLIENDLPDIYERVPKL